MDTDAWYIARDFMVDAVVADLHGTDEDDELTELPLDRYIVGILYPRTSSGQLIPAEDVNNEPEMESTAIDAEFDPAVSFAHVRRPSTMGLTFGLSAATRAVRITVRADRYLPAGREDKPVPDMETAPTRKSRPARWIREPFRPEALTLTLEPNDDTIPLTEGLALRVVCRPQRDGVISMTVVLVNLFEQPARGLADAFAWFRPGLAIATVDGEFVDRRPPLANSHLDEDELSGRLLYRHQRPIAVGHGVSVNWDDAPRVTRVSTTYFPTHDLRLAKAEIKDIAGLGMKSLAEGNLGGLGALVERYEQWIDLQSRERADIPESLHATADAHIRAAREAAARMRRGVALLESDADAERAFRLMNQAMYLQRTRQIMISDGAKEPPENPVAEWRPFQIAFILLNLEGLIDPSSAERDTADLLWFPTGGGKTEAYLGLIGFTLLIRRLLGVGQDRTGAGVGVIMRYTLRLLTLQQFERAAGLICALEELRSGEPDLREVAPFSIGLWVGQGATPNDGETAAKAIKRRRAGDEPGDAGDPIQLLRCPWCGVGLDAFDYEVDRHTTRMSVRCPNGGCRFRQGLPVHLIDSDVYEARPSLLIGTVDKFAMLAWTEKSGRLFSRGDDAPPDLIVQDELHLISGPLGSLVGLYETAVDHLASDPSSGVRPKLIASTATIRRAGQQVRAVFAREARQFPPPGLEAGDSFFAVDAQPDEKGTRRYVGLLAPSASHSTLLVRTYAALLQAGSDLPASDEVRDAYWTLLGYFSSLRVLGAAFIQSIDDVRDRVGVVAKRNGTTARDTRDPIELTSRVKSSEIPEVLRALNTSYPDQASPTTVLATNMISVGVDVERLGLMAVMGQPQSTSEYIQATSRVGRKHPGLVFTLYNASRSRDLSHYEGFTSYHRALYQQVEATGATPFAERALDRALHGVLVAMARHGIPSSHGDTDVRVPVELDALGPITEVIRQRVSRVGIPAAELDELQAQVSAALEVLVTQWAAAVGEGVQKYGRWRPGPVKTLMVPAGGDTRDVGGDALVEEFPPSEVPWPTLTSLRNVDRESTLRIVSGYSKATKGGNDG